jgi:hypothetical protein
MSRKSSTIRNSWDCYEFNDDSFGPKYDSKFSSNGPKSKYKIYLDKTFRRYYQNDNANSPTTGVVHLRNVTKGLVIHNNTFSKIYNIVGGVITIIEFNNTFGTLISLY